MTTIRHNGYEIVDGMLALPNGPMIVGTLSLNGCKALNWLPEGLSVGRYVHLRDCTALTSLPKGLTVGGSLDLEGCTALTSLPNGLTVGGSIFLQGCTALTSLPDGLTVGVNLFTDYFFLENGELSLAIAIPETVTAGLVGRMICEVIEHHWLERLGVSDRIISSAEMVEADYESPFLRLEFDPLDRPFRIAA